MLDPSVLYSAMRQSADLWVKGQSREALKILDEWIGRAERENETDWVDLLCGQASSIADSMGDLRLVRQYCEKVLGHEGETTLTRAMALYKLADALFRQGEIDAAKQHAARSYALVLHPTSDEDRGLLELLVKVWPEITTWKA